VITVALVSVGVSGGMARAAVSCDFVAAPGGSDAAAGSVAAPFASVQRLVSALGPGQTGCLRAGDYVGVGGWGGGGGGGAPITLTSFAGESATVTGRMYVPQGADHVTVTGLALDGRNAQNLPSPTVDATDATFSYDDVTDDHTAICFALGNGSWGVAVGTEITNSRIHDCGILPARNYNHGIYVDDASNTRIEWNLIYDNADRGIQLYPDAQNTVIDHNVIDGNGEGILFSGDGGTASDGTQVYDNLITGSKVRSDVESWYPAGNPVGTGNTVHDNCVWNGAQGTIDTASGGFSATANLVADPQYVNAGTGDYHLQPTSPCLTMTGDIAAAMDQTTPTPPTGTGTTTSGGGSSSTGSGATTTTTSVGSVPTTTTSIGSGSTTTTVAGSGTTSTDPATTSTTHAITTGGPALRHHRRPHRAAVLASVASVSAAHRVAHHRGLRSHRRRRP
jgi:parallel beta-helix repeat protein